MGGDEAPPPEDAKGPLDGGDGQAQSSGQGAVAGEALALLVGVGGQGQVDPERRAVQAGVEDQCGGGPHPWPPETGLLPGLPRPASLCYNLFRWQSVFGLLPRGGPGRGGGARAACLCLDGHC